MSVSYAWTTLHIEDLDKSLKFYRDVVGMKVVMQYRIEPVDEDVAVIEQAGGGKIELVARKGFKLSLSEQENFSLAIETDDAKSVIDSLGNEMPQPIVIDEHTKFFFTNDPDGYPLNIIEKK